MLEDLLTWLQLINQSAPQSPLVAINQSNVIFIAYLLTFKRSWYFAAAFLLCESLSRLNFFTLFDSLSPTNYGIAFYLAICLAWSMAISSQIKPNMNKGLSFYCNIMILFLLFMAWDSWTNATIETYAYENYANIIVCIHACIIASLYKPTAIIDAMVYKFRNTCCYLLNTYTVRFICYNFG